MADLGVRRVPLSGAGWIEKEDGATLDFPDDGHDLMVQLKSTEGQQITVKVSDVRALIKHANQSHALPVFALDFMGADLLLLAVRPDDLMDAARAYERLQAAKQKADQ